MTEGELPRLLYLFALGLLIATAMFAAYRNRMGTALRHGAIWALIFLGLVLLYGFRDVIGVQLASAPVVSAGDDRAMLRRGPDGHFRAGAEVNGAEVVFLVDTGATDIVLTRRDADRAGFEPQELVFSRPAMTANGLVYGAPVRLEALQVGPFIDHDIPAVVNGGELSTSLLGMAWLDGFSRWWVEGDRMILER